MRHSIPERCDLPTERLPLSEEGIRLALSKKALLKKADRCFSSPYNRALETAGILFDGNVIVKDNLH